jgi:isoleucyl-tRNA synthetase
LRDARDVVLKSLEDARAARTLGTSLEAQVTLTGPPDALKPLRDYEGPTPGFPSPLASLFIVSAVELRDGEGPLSVTVSRAGGGKCERCWTYSNNVGRQGVHPGVCERCAAVLEELR